MKKLYIIITALIVGILSGYAQTDVSDSTTIANDKAAVAPTVIDNNTNVDNLWQQANEAFIEGQYPKAVADYEAILERGEYSAALYYNLGNAYFQQNRIGKAILNYTRAHNLAPSDEDVEYNLQLARARTKDKIEPVPEFFLKRWLLSGVGLMSSDNWAWCGLLFFAIAICGVLMWLISNRFIVRKSGFFVGVVALILSIGSLSYATMAGDAQFAESGAVVINSAVAVKSSPAEGGKDLFVLHEGTVVDVLQALGEWREVSLADGNKGWLRADAIEMLN